jgi:CRP-like cAMP-binding protein
MELAQKVGEPFGPRLVLRASQLLGDDLRDDSASFDALKQGAHVVVSGRVALDMFVPHKGKVRFYTCEAWEVVGWSGVTPEVHQRIAGAVAVMDTALISTGSEALRQLCEADHDLGYLVMRRMANVVASRLVVTRLQLLDMFAQPMETKNVD